MAQYLLKDDDLGDIIISLRRGMKSIKYRVHNGSIKISAPEGIDPKFIRSLIDMKKVDMKRLIAAYEEKGLKYHNGQVIKCLGGYEIVITSQNHAPLYMVTARIDEKTFAIKVPEGINLDNENVKRHISKLLKSFSKFVAIHTLHGVLQHVAAEINLAVPPMSIGNGLRKLGHCSSKGKIQLSSFLVFLPQHLAEYVIKHELAHLTVFNHSPQFHALLDRYCHGRSTALKKELDSFKWPILK